MRSVEQLLADAKKADVTWTVTDGILDIDCPPGQKSLALELRRRDAEILQHLGYQPSKVVDDWPEPKPLPGLSGVMAFTFDLLPERLRGWVYDIAQRMQVPADFPAVAAVIILAAIVGRKVTIRPKRKDDWTVVPNLWGAIVARPSLMKSPSLAEPLNVLKRLEIEAKQQFDEAGKAAEAAELVDKARHKERDSAIAKALKEGGDAEAVAASYLNDRPQRPTRRRYLVNDTSVEKVGEILGENPNGVLLFRDELVGFLKSLDREGQEGARTFYLEAWNGNGRYTFDRIGRGTLDIESTCISVLGGIQPGPLSAYIRECVRGGRGDDGLLQRFQLLVWPDTPTAWENVDRYPDTDAKNIAYDAFQRLEALDPLTIGAVPTENGSPYVRFAAEAQDEFDQWRADLERRIREDGEPDSITAHLSKYRSLVPSLALLFHLADDGRDEVGIHATRRAIDWARYLETHARRLYGAAVNSGRQSTQALANKIKAGEVPEVFALRDIYNNGWSNLSDREDTAEAVKVLTDLDWLAERKEATTGRTATKFAINPKTRKNTKAPLCEPAEPAKAPFAGFAGTGNGPKPFAELTAWNASEVQP